DIEMTLTETITINEAVDPSRTLVLRRAFSNAVKKRFIKFTKNLIQVVSKDNSLGMVANLKVWPGAFNFPDSSDKIFAFTKWVNEQAKEDILDVGMDTNNTWVGLYIRESYKRGVIRARTQIQKIAPP